MTEGTREWSLHPIAFGGNADRVPKLSGAHLWVWSVLFRAWPGAKVLMLDNESMLRVAGISCHYCDSEYTRAEAGRVCNGTDRPL